MGVVLSAVTVYTDWWHLLYVKLVEIHGAHPFLYVVYVIVGAIVVLDLRYQTVKKQKEARKYGYA